MFARVVSGARSVNIVKRASGTLVFTVASLALVTLTMLSVEDVSKRPGSALVCPMWRGSTVTAAQKTRSLSRMNGGQDQSCQHGRSPSIMLTAASLASLALRT